MHKRIRLSIVFCFLLLALITTFGTKQTFAAGSCDLLINDGAKVLTSNQKSKVTAAAKNLEASAPKSAVRVVTVSKSSSDLLSLAYKQCGKSWFKNSSSLKSNMILLMVKPFTPGKQDGKSVVAAGSMYSEVNANNTTILVAMKPDFQSKQYADGLITGLNKIKSLVQSTSHPSGNGTVTNVTVNQKPADLTPLWVILGIIVVGGGLGVVVFLMIRARRAKKEEDNEKLSAQHEAQMIRNEAVNSVRNLTDTIADPALQARLAIASQNSPINSGKLEQSFSNLSTGVSNLSINMRNVTSSTSNPDNDNLSSDGYYRIRDYFAERVREAKIVQQELHRFEQNLSEAERNPDVQIGSRQLEWESPSSQSENRKAFEMDDDEYEVIEETTTTTTVEEIVEEEYPQSYYQAPAQTYSEYDIRQAFQNADHELMTSERYIRLNWYYVGLQAKQLLHEAYDRLQQAQRARKPQYRLEKALDAQQMARDAYSLAYNDVSSGIDYRHYGWYEAPSTPWYESNLMIGVLAVPILMMALDNEPDYYINNYTFAEGNFGDETQSFSDDFVQPGIVEDSFGDEEDLATQGVVEDTFGEEDIPEEGTFGDDESSEDYEESDYEDNSDYDSEEGSF